MGWELGILDSSRLSCTQTPEVFSFVNWYFHGRKPLEVFLCTQTIESILMYANYWKYSHVRKLYCHVRKPLKLNSRKYFDVRMNCYIHVRKLVCTCTQTPASTLMYANYYNHLRKLQKVNWCTPPPAFVADILERYSHDIDFLPLW